LGKSETLASAIALVDIDVIAALVVPDAVGKPVAETRANVEAESDMVPDSVEVIGESGTPPKLPEPYPKIDEPLSGAELTSYWTTTALPPPAVDPDEAEPVVVML
tara:strand:+ start:971 stop:1285 length:315 start_codon:yes stop_codon:yes gene_type:complete